MFSLKMRDLAFCILSFICCFKGLACSPQWTMEVKPQVNGSLGQNVILPCVFTHPKQDTYSGFITVKWSKKDESIFHCKLYNRTNRSDNCTNRRSSERLSLIGDPRKGDLSLCINSLKFTDATQYPQHRYNCRVELDYNKLGKNIELNVNAPAQILSLALDLDAKTHVMMVKCIAQGNPIPEVKLTASSGPLKYDPIKIEHTNYLISSSVPFSDQDMYTCNVMNLLGRDQKTFPTDHPKFSGLLVATCFLGCLLLLGLVAFILYMMKRRRSFQGVMQQHIDVQRVQSSIYETNEIVYANVSTGCETTQDQVYSEHVSLAGRKVEPIPGPQNQKNPRRPPLTPHSTPFPPPPTAPPSKITRRK